MVGLLIGFALRLYQLGAESLWYDETVSVYLSRQPIPDLIAHTARDIHPPGYYLLLHWWQTLTQPTLSHGLEFLYAWPSLLAGMLLLPLIYTLGRKLFDPSLALMALWLAAVHPYHLWYSQEVRMYTVGAFLGLLCLWSILKWQAADGKQWTQFAIRNSQFTHLLIYVIAAVAGLYTLYYFALLLISLNLFVFLATLGHKYPVTHDQQTVPVPNPQSSISNTQYSISKLLPWLLAQLALLLFWLPWLPVFWRQVTEPPVPPWRREVDALLMLRETLAAALVGQSPPVNDLLWTGITAVLLLAALFGYAKVYQRRSLTALLLYSFAPLLLIYFISIWLTPLYHIRYFFTYAAPLPLLLALGLRILTRGSRPLLAGGFALILLVSAWSLSEFWTHPRYRADDHRAAVADLAAGWRPGDAVLVNAGWVYPALDVYWPQEMGDATASRPPFLSQRIRLLDYTNQDNFSSPMLITTGSVDGSLSLGWGLAESDFYPMAQAAAQASLTYVSNEHPRIWHYRLYDTVNDPAGSLRTILADLADLIWDQPYPGRDFLRLQLYETPAGTDDRFCPQSDAEIDFGAALRLLGQDAPRMTPAGSTLYTTLCWQALEGVAAYPNGLRTSLRLYRADIDGEILVSQFDAAPLRSTPTWTAGSLYRQPLALPISAALPPGTYNLALIVYNGGDGEPLPPSAPAAVEGQRWRLGAVDIALPPAPPPASGSLARFDYIELQSATAPATASPGDLLEVTTVWRPQPNAYRDTYDAVYFLAGEATGQLWRVVLGGAGYPSGDWAAGYPVQQRDQLLLPTDLPPGDYRLSVHLERASDGLPIPARSGPLLWQTHDSFLIGAIAVK